MVKYPQTKSDRKKARRDRNPRKSIRGVCKKLRFTNELQDLTDCSKQGNEINAYNITKSIAIQYFGNSSADRMFLFMIRCLVIPDTENRSAVYYAAQAGHTNLVRTYLALLVLARSIRRPKQAAVVDRPIGIRDWLNHLGYLDFFTSKDLDLCILSALNDSVAAIFSQQKYSLVDLRNIVMLSPWSNHVPENVAKLKLEKKGKPFLFTDDDYSVVDDFIQDHSDEDGDHKDGFDFSTIRTDIDDEVVLQLYQMMVIDESNETKEAATIEEGEADRHIDDEWSEVHSTSSSFVYAGDELIEDGDDWSILSNTASIKSINSVPISYSDALRFGKKAAVKTIVEGISEVDTEVDLDDGKTKEQVDDVDETKAWA